MKHAVIRLFSLLMLPMLLVGTASAAPLLEGKPLATALAGGGYVILMRHANSTEKPPGRDEIAPGNVGHERQLTKEGQASARAMGEALKRLKIPLGKVLSSTAYRALETARLADFPEPHTYDDLSETGKSPERTASLRAEVALVPEAVTNTVMITQVANIAAAFGEDAKNLGEGDALIYRPDGQGKVALVAKVKIDDWPKIAAAK